MRKKLLFIIPSLHSGGAEKSLINLLKVLDYNRYEVDLFLFKKGGVFYDILPSQVNIIEKTENHKIFGMSVFSSSIAFFKKFRFDLIYYRILFVIINKLYAVNRAEQYGWKCVKKSIGVYDKRYDVAFGYLEKSSIYCCVDCFKADKKIGFIRVDYNSLGLNKSFDISYFKKLIYLCANGKLSLNVLEQNFPELKDKLKLVFNVTLASTIKEMSDEFRAFSNNKINLVTVGRLHHQKGYDIAIQACRIIVEKGYEIVWNVIGNGPEKENLLNLVQENDVSDCFVFLGEKHNPYPYIGQSFIYVQPSRYEGKSNTINEAKILGKPIVVTDFDTVFEQIENEINGLIVKQNPVDLANAIIRLIESEELRNQFAESLKNVDFDYNKELNVFYELIES